MKKWNVISGWNEIHHEIQRDPNGTIRFEYKLQMLDYSATANVSGFNLLIVVLILPAIYILKKKPNKNSQ